VLDFRIVISDQTEDSDPVGLARFRLCCVSSVLTVIPSISTNICPAVAAAPVFVRAGAGEYSLSHDDLILEPDVVERMLIAIQRKAVVSLAAPLLGLAILMMSAPMSRKSSFGIGQLSRKWSNLAHRSERWRLHNALTSTIQQRFGSTQIGNANIALPGL